MDQHNLYVDDKLLERMVYVKKVENDVYAIDFYKGKVMDVIYADLERNAIIEEK